MEYTEDPTLETDKPVVELPPVEDDTIETESNEPLTSEQFAKAQANSVTGQYETTLFEMWHEYLEVAIQQAEEPLSMVVANGLLRQWPWLRYFDLPGYLATRTTYLHKAMRVLEECYPKPAELLYLENEDDWERHKDDYIKVIVAWTVMTQDWNEAWMAIPLNKPQKGVVHAAAADAIAMILNTDNGIIEWMRNLAGFNITEAEGADMMERIAAGGDDV
jgi:hypothetical protein